MSVFAGHPVALTDERTVSDEEVVIRQDLRLRYAAFTRLLEAAQDDAQRNQVRRIRSHLTSALIANGWKPIQLADILETTCDTVGRWRRRPRDFEYDGIELPDVPPCPETRRVEWTVAEVAAHLQVDRTSVRRWIESGWLPARRHGLSTRSPYLIHPAALELRGILEPTITAEQYGAAVRVTARQVRIWVQKGKLPRIRLGGSNGALRLRLPQRQPP